MAIKDHEFTPSILEQLDIDRQRFALPSQWPLRPRLPMKQHAFKDGRHAKTGAGATGFLVEGEGPIVHMQTRIDRKATRLGRLQAGCLHYASWDDLQRDGWIID